MRIYKKKMFTSSTLLFTKLYTVDLTYKTIGCIQLVVCESYNFFPGQIMIYVFAGWGWTVGINSSHLITWIATAPVQPNHTHMPQRPSNSDTVNIPTTWLWTDLEWSSNYYQSVGAEKYCIVDA